MSSRDFETLYPETGSEKKLDFLEQLLLKNSDLQQQFIEFARDRGRSLDALTAVDIDAVRDELWSDITAIDVDDEMERGCHYDYYYDDDGTTGDAILEEIFDPYVNTALSFVDRGNYLDAFRFLLAVYELRLIETPDVQDDNYFVFGEALEEYIDDRVSSALSSFDAHMRHKVLSVETVRTLIDLFFKRYALFSESDNEDEKPYNIAHFKPVFEHLTDQPETARYLLAGIRSHGLDRCIGSAGIVLHCADIIGDDVLYLDTANAFFMEDKVVALKLQSKYQEMGLSNELAGISRMLFEKRDNADYALFVIEHIDREAHLSLYIDALKIYTKAKYSFEHYQLLREYLNPEERLTFIHSVNSRFNDTFYIQLLEREKQYEAILNFAEKHSDSYRLEEIVKPIVSIYPEKVFELIRKKCDKLVEARGRSAYAEASRLLRMISATPRTKEALTVYISALYNHQPRLPALRDELRKVGLV